MKSMKPGCDPNEVALKNFFLGPQAENGPWVAAAILETLERWFAWRKSLFPKDGKAISDLDQQLPEFTDKRRQFAETLNELTRRFESEVPKFSPRYVGHMFSEISLPALFGHFVALLHNPNNISVESSKVGVEIEKEAIAALLSMIGFDPEHASGHFTSGGTVANFEALVRARARMAIWLSAGAGAGKKSLFEAALSGWDAYERNINTLGEGKETLLKDLNFTESNPWIVADRLKGIFGTPFRGPVVLVPENKHYSWKKGVSLLGLGEDAFWPVSLDSRGKLSVSSLKEQLERARAENRPVMMVVSVAGATELGEFDPIHDVQDVLDQWKTQQGLHVWHHIDAAFGGFFRALDLNDGTLLKPHLRRDLMAIERADSVTLDPHKLGYVPFSCGAFLARTRRDYYVQGFDAPYVQFKRQDLGPFTLEGSRSATGATATWMIARSIGLDPDGYGRILARTVRMRQELADKLNENFLQTDVPLRIAPYADTNILCFTLAREGEPISVSNARTLRLFDAFSPQGQGPFFVSKTRLSWNAYGRFLDTWVHSWDAQVDESDLALIRMTLMNPFFGSKETRVKYAQELVDSIQAFIKGL